MKRLLTAIILLTLTAANAGARIYIGAEAGISAKDNNITLAFAPDAGFQISDRFRTGVCASFRPTTGIFEWLVNPYARFAVLKFGGFGICAQVGVLAGGQKANNADTVYAFGANLLPVLSFAINDHFTFHTKLDLLGISFANGTATANESSFAFGLNKDAKVFGALSDISLGISYVF